MKEHRRDRQTFETPFVLGVFSFLMFESESVCARGGCVTAWARLLM